MALYGRKLDRRCKVKKRLIVFLLTVCLTAFSLGIVADAGADYRPDHLPNQVLVKFQGDVSGDVIESIVAQVRGKIMKKFHLLPLYRLRVPRNTVNTVVDLLNSLPEVEYAEPNYLRYLNATPNDPSYSQMWGLNNTGQTGGTFDADIDAPEAWDITTGDPGIAVAVLDSGIDSAHEDLTANIWTNPGEVPGNGIDDDGNGYVDDVNGWDFARNDNVPNEESICGGHGTHTSGTIGAVGNNGTGVTGINWNVRIMPLKIFKRYLLIFCSTSSADIIEAVEYASMMGVRVSNNSYGGGPYSQAEFDAIRASGTIFVAAAGNGGLDGIGDNNDITPEYPASYELDNIISVAATNHDDILASFSNYGSVSVDLSAPGVNVLSTTPGDTYSYFSGTSMATPHVAGSVALLMAYDSAQTNNEVRWRILNGTDYLGIPVLTGGRLNIYNALSLPAPVVTISVTPNGSTLVSPGDTVSYNVRLENTGPAPKSGTASVVVVMPDGSEEVLMSYSSTAPGNTVASQNFSIKIPVNTVPGEYQLVGRVEVPGESYDEDIVLYSVQWAAVSSR